jgi:DnaB-like helicase N terminal domain
MNAPFTTPIRTAPHKIEAEQALLGAILVNNEVFYRVSDFLEPKHFLEGIHQRIYEIAGDLIRAGKLATPVTLKSKSPCINGSVLEPRRRMPRPKQRSPQPPSASAAATAGAAR